MIGLIASIGLIVAIFVSEVAFSHKGLQGDAKLGALLSAATAFVCFAIGNVVDYKNEDVIEQDQPCICHFMSLDTISVASAISCLTALVDLPHNLSATGEDADSGRVRSAK